MRDALTLRQLLALTMADIDIRLLQNKEQTADNDKEHFTHEEIRKQLQATIIRLTNVLSQQGLIVDKPTIDLLTIPRLPISHN
jgi:hypothetical protein